MSDGDSRQHTDDGCTREVSYRAGDVRHFTFSQGEYLLHDLENIGDRGLVFVTVEHKRVPRVTRGLGEPITTGYLSAFRDAAGFADTSPTRRTCPQQTSAPG